MKIFSKEFSAQSPKKYMAGSMETGHVFHNGSAKSWVELVNMSVSRTIYLGTPLERADLFLLVSRKGHDHIRECRRQI